MLEEQLKQSLIQTLVHFNQEGLTIGTEFYILKDVYNDFLMTYQKYLEEQSKKAEEDIESMKEEKENDSDDVH
jgi:hypothetical protein